MDRGTKKACRVTEALEEEKGGYAQAASYLGVNPSLVWRAIHKDYAAPKLIYALAKKGLVERPAPKEIRPRVWMRTDDIEKAVEQLLKYYTLEDVMAYLEENHLPFAPSLDSGEESGLYPWGGWG